MLIAAPLLLLYVGGLLADLPLGRETELFLGAIVGALRCSRPAWPRLAALVSALTIRRGLAVAAVIVVLLVSYTVVSTIQGISFETGHETVGQVAGIFSPYTLVNGVQVFLFDSPEAHADPARQRRDGRVLPGSPPRSSSWARSARCCSATARSRGEGAMSTLQLDHVSRWYRNVVAVNDVTMNIGPGVTGLLGPNGAGKTTLIAMMSGFLAPSTGTVTLDGEPLWRNEQVYRKIGLVPEREALFDYLTGRQFVVANAELHGLPDPGAAAQSSIALVEMTRRAGPRHLDVLQGHAAADQDGVVPGPPTRPCCCSTSPSTAWTRGSGST